VDATPASYIGVHGFELGPREPDTPRLCAVLFHTPIPFLHNSKLATFAPLDEI